MTPAGFDLADRGALAYHVVRGAIEVGLFRKLAVPCSPASLARVLALDPKSVDLVCGYLVSMGLLSRRGDLLQVTQDSAFLSDFGGRGADAFLMLWDSYGQVSAQLRGLTRSEPLRVISEDFWIKFHYRSLERWQLERRRWLQLWRTVGGLTQRIPPGKTIVDFGSGIGLASTSLAEVVDAAEIYFVDFPEVASMAVRLARRATCVKSLARPDMLDVYGWKPDCASIVLAIDVLYYLSDQDCIDFGTAALRILSAGGVVVVAGVDIHQGDDWLLDRSAQELELYLLGCPGTTRSVDIYANILSSIGFRTYTPSSWLLVGQAP